MKKPSSSLSSKQQQQHDFSEKYADDVLLDKIFGNPLNLIPLNKLDKWVEQTILKNPNIIIITGDSYPYKNYTFIDDLLRKYGKEYINGLLKICPFKYKEIKYDIQDSVAFVIHNRRIDPKSLFDIPTYKSLWDRISDHSHS